MTAVPGHPRHRRRFTATAAVAVLCLLLLGPLGGCAGAGGNPGDDPQGGATGGPDGGYNRRVAASALEDAERRWAEDVERRWATGTAAAPGPTYRLNPGDMLQISVWREEELQRQVLVQPDGSISFPLVGQIIAAGRTASEVEDEIARRLDRFVPNAVATVELVEATGNKIYVMGEVNRQGEYQMGGPLTVVQAISLAGGFTDLAARDRIRVLREEDGRERTITVDYGRVASGRDVAANVELEAGDTVIVPAKVLGLF